MTTVTESIRAFHAVPLEDSGYEAMRENPALAERFAHELADAARRLTGGQRWTIEEILEILELATSTQSSEPQVLEGRYFRKRLRHHARRAERTGSSCSVAVLTLAQGTPENVYGKVLKVLSSQLRACDMAFLYRRRISLVLPELQAEHRDSVLRRIPEVRQGSLERVAAETFPGPRFENTAALLAWAEDQLRDEPIDE